MRPSFALPIHRDRLRGLAAKWGFPTVHVFGSTARGDDREGSDLDLLIHLGEDEKFFDAFNFMVEAQALVPEVKLDAVVDAMVRPEIVATAKREGFLL